MNNDYLWMRALALVLGLTGPVTTAHAAPDEIVVFTDEFQKKGEVGYELHLNYTTHARKTPDYPREQAPHRIFRVMPEVVWGIAENWNLGVHVPFSYNVNSHSTTVDGLKVRLQYFDVIERGKDSAFYYGINNEIAVYHKRITESRYNLELRGIVGVKHGDWKMTLNPIFNQALSRNPGGRAFEFELFGQVLREFNEDFALGFEHYSSFGRVSNPTFGSLSDQTSYLIAEFRTKKNFDIHLGIGHGWTEAADKRVFKAMIGLPL